MTPDADSTFFHEDDFCQIEILPSENVPQLLTQAENIEDFSKEHADGYGFTDIYVREQEEVGLAQRGISTQQLDAFLNQLTQKKRYEHVTTGIHKGEFICSHIVAYVDDVANIYYKHENHVVQHLWLIYGSGTDSHLTQVLSKLGTTWDLVLMDWSAGILLDLKDQEKIQKYVEEE